MDPFTADCDAADVNVALGTPEYRVKRSKSATIRLGRPVRDIATYRGKQSHRAQRCRRLLGRHYRPQPPGPPSGDATFSDPVRARACLQGGRRRRQLRVRACAIPAEEAARKLGYADVAPVVGSLAVAPDGGVWLRRRTDFPDELPIDVLDTTGVYAGTFARANRRFRETGLGNCHRPSLASSMAS